MLKTIVVSNLETNCYLFSDDKSGFGVIIDPGDEADKIIEEIKITKTKIKYIINTHGHPDHILANHYIKKYTGAEVLAHKGDVCYFQQLGLMFDKQIDDGNEIKVSENFVLKTIHTPGHSQGCICILYNNIVFTGDTLFCECIGRTDLPGGNDDKILDSIKNKLMKLDDNTEIYPGHGSKCTIGGERKHNPYCR